VPMSQTDLMMKRLAVESDPIDGGSTEELPFDVDDPRRDKRPMEFEMKPSEDRQRRGREEQTGKCFCDWIWSGFKCVLIGRRLGQLPATTHGHHYQSDGR